MVELLAELDHFGIGYNSFVKEGMLNLSGEHALVEYVGQFLLCKILKFLVDQEFNEVVWVFENASHNLVVEFRL